MSVPVLIGLGANLGDRRGTLERALELLAEAGVAVGAVSAWIETEPEGAVEAQGRYLNGAARLETALGPLSLLEILLQTERRLGRKRTPGQRNEARTIDLDLLLYGELLLQGAALVLPHPRLHLRRFVLEPLGQIAPQARHPVLNRTMAELLIRLEADQE